VTEQQKLDNLSQKYIIDKKSRGYSMQTMTVGEVKAHFSEVLDLVQKGEDVVISFGKKKDKIAVLVPFSHYQGKPQRKLGLLEGKASFAFRDDFAITDEELLKL
jgi:antitoxin (DNA-binding transcriptional repressor) of toxin-antitoxin stability system